MSNVESEVRLIRALAPLASPGGLRSKRAAAIQMAGSVLVVEDNDRLGEILTGMLEDLGLASCLVTSAEAALEVLGNDLHGHDLLLCDVVLTGMSGIALARTVRAMRPDMPIILSSGYSDNIVAGYGEEFELLEKPYTIKQLNEALAPYLAQRQTAATAA